MIDVTPLDALGSFQNDWLDTRYHFSFADYYDPARMGVGPLRVWNDDRIKPQSGFPMHPHKDMEILTYVLEGAIEHKDSLGNGGIIRPGEVQRMSAGTGIYHSEFNPSRKEDLHLMQIWLFPTRRGIRPSYAQKKFAPADRNGRLRLVASPRGDHGSMREQHGEHVWQQRLPDGRGCLFPRQFLGPAGRTMAPEPRCVLRKR